MGAAGPKRRASKKSVAAEAVAEDVPEASDVDIEAEVGEELSAE